ncbi:glycerophosphoinositol inositolphosphodiesterase GDPD2 isoform X1 [Podarcis raffonei]|uniref:glycerophosphoinositol inositolphosphodiesterase GDPD2 isoform X1 n=2 Tax=Podarcis raffonei TaxID=65483 RepID=UPI0023293797|nr:glycerophosphoinositol inositolphosphodiesterase GDPD2 isoform X1 [Podarcis raffonei]XP_053229679.1 glycerophosphoinositol inositolphosphodiesterase GDPD2 isoform X1 [Podarcis raffonei]XP_053229680.1 glycerophosphoinositol inositolphosphodiesterase GDPD2 isoform X1 [Podarcis raffonei]
MVKDAGCCSRCATCLLCLYSCRWTRNKKGLVTSKCDCAWFFFVFCVCLFALAWFYLAFVTLNDFHNLNEFIFRKTGWWLDWSMVMLSGTTTLVTFSSLLLVLALCLQLWHQPLKLHWIHKVLLILTALVVASAFVGVEVQWEEQWESARISLQATGPFLHIGAVVGMTLLAWPVADCFYRTSCSVLRTLLLLLYLGAVFALYLAPLGIDSPCLLEYSQLPPKPALFGHRGAPMLAPENTLMSFRKAVDYGVSVLETDVLVSVDGVPFIMHDEKLIRTTNVQEVFPAQAQSNASSFNWTQLQQLDAGSWFLQKPPFPTARSLSKAERALAQAQRVLSLKQLLVEAKRHNVSVMFDLRPEEDPHYEDLVNVTVETILHSDISPELILWLPDEFRDWVKQRAPRFQQVYGRKKLSNETEDLMRINLPYQNLSSTEIREYRRDNISVNLYVVNAPWLFSILWCAGANSVTTNACQVLQGMERPLWLLPRATYQMIWIVTDCVSFLLIVWAFFLLKKWSRRKEPQGYDSDVLLTKIHSLLSE